MISKKDKLTMIELMNIQWKHYKDMATNKTHDEEAQLIYYTGIETAYNQLLLAAGTGQIIIRLDNGKHKIVNYRG